MNHVCLAYFPRSPDERGQTIEEHIIRGLEFLEEMYLERGFAEYLVRLAKYFKVELSLTESRNAIYASYIFHDLGKISKEYQEKKSGFSGHEIISAYWVMEHGSQLALGKMLYHVALAIYLHHHDMRRGTKTLQKVNLCSECLRKILDIYEGKTSINLASYKTRFRGELSSGLTRYLNRIEKEDVRLSYPLLQVVHGVDNYSALEREGKPSVLSTEVRKVVDAVRLLREDFGRVFR
ncbi:MAG: CRISPR-associated endonuclease Cas3'' [Nitrososphaerota archaeon]